MRRCHLTRPFNMLWGVLPDLLAPSLENHGSPVGRELPLPPLLVFQIP